MLGFDLLESVLDWEEQQVIEFDFERHYVFSEKHMHEQTRDIGYEQANSIMLLNTLVVVMFLYFAKLIVYICM